MPLRGELANAVKSYLKAEEGGLVGLAEAFRLIADRIQARMDASGYTSLPPIDDPSVEGLDSAG